jgi:hypothetical protein
VYPYNKNPPEWNKPFENIELNDPKPGQAINEVSCQLNFGTSKVPKFSTHNSSWSNVLFIG